ncbi:hypothetical protein VPH35_108175 [Triticum aestivum]|uniref:Myb/SANT-like domain-containing protein n=1 Tax=Triticum aestivum TaxID=4565 RepID=A0A3B6PGM8_WHEAT|nr:uncharacterized protein At2g29880-like [Triticum aestivum]XP_044410571.1 uncharacterized protein At2g29880-like [Triticum aestivum]
MVHQLNSFELPGSRVQSQGFLDMDVDRARGRVQSQGLGAIDADRARSRGQSQGLGDIDDDHGAVEYPRDIGMTKRAKWTHQMKLFLIDLLKEHDVPGFRTQNAWSKEAWTNIVNRLNQAFCVSFSVVQVKQKEQDIKKEYRSVKELLAESGFGWDKDRMMVEAPASVWASFVARKNSNEALQWRDKSFPYFNDLASLYDGRYAEGRSRHGMDYYANKAKNASAPSSHPTHSNDTYESSSPPTVALDEPGLQFPLEEEVEGANLDSVQHTSTPNEQMYTQSIPPKAPTVKPESRRRKRQKQNPTSSADGFHERYLRLKMEEINRFAAIEEKKLEAPFSIHKCITTIEGLDGLQLSDMLLASDIFKTRENREIFLSFSSDERRLAWIKREIARTNEN